MSDDGRRTEPRLATALRTLVYAVTGAVIAYPLSVTEGMVAAAVGAGLGAFAARFVAKSALRLPAIGLLGGLGVLGVLLARWLVVDLAFVPAWVGPADALLGGEAVVFGLGGLVLATTLRAFSIRQPAVTILEAALVAGGFATLMVAHRHGAIHRPYALADPLIAAGEDPTAQRTRVLARTTLAIGVLELGESSINFAVRPWVKAADYFAVLLDLNETVKRRFDEAGFHIPFPQRDVHVHQKAA